MENEGNFTPTHFSILNPRKINRIENKNAMECAGVSSVFLF